MKIPVYTLPKPRSLERSLLKQIDGSVKPHVEWKVFPSGEHYCRVRDVEEAVCVIGRLDPPGDNFFQTVLLIDTLRRNGAKTINVIIPYLAYARQDRQIQSGDPVTIGCVLRQLAAAGADRLIVADLHSFRPLDSSPIPIESVSLLRQMAAKLPSELLKRDYTVVAVDRGGQARADAFAHLLRHGDGAIWVEKTRSISGRVFSHSVIGRVSGTAAVIVDDMVDTGSSIMGAIKLLKKKGLKDFYLCVTHPICSVGAAKRLLSVGFKRIIISDTLPIPDCCRNNRTVTVVSVAAELVAALFRRPGGLAQKLPRR